jgi:hypothetical protein
MSYIEMVAEAVEKRGDQLGWKLDVLRLAWVRRDGILSLPRRSGFLQNAKQTERLRLAAGFGWYK